jgi:hypothetical protein
MEQLISILLLVILGVNTTVLALILYITRR